MEREPMRTELDEVEFDAQEFARAVKAGGSAAVEALRLMSDAAKKFQSDPSHPADVVAAYLEHRPQAEEVLMSMEVEKGVLAVAALDTLNIMLEVDSGKGIARTIVKQHSRRLFNILSRDRGRMARLALELLSKVAVASVPHAREIVTRFNLGAKDLMPLLRARTHTRVAFVRLLTTLFKSKDETVLTTVALRCRRAVVAILRDMNDYDDAGSAKSMLLAAEAEFVSAFCVTLKVLPKSSSVKSVISRPVLEHVAQLSSSRVRGDPAMADAREAFLFCCARNAITSAADVSAALMSTQLFSNNDALDLVRLTLHQRPRAAAVMLHDSKLNLSEPKLSVNWIATAAVLLTALTVPLPENCNEKDVLPERIFDQPGIEKGLVHADRFIRFTALQLVLACVRRLVAAQSEGKIAELAVLPSANSLIAAAKLAIKDGGMVAGLGAEMLHLFLQSETRVLSDSRATVARIAFSQENDIFAGSDRKVSFAAKEILRLTDFLVSASSHEFFAGSGEKFSLFGQLYVAQASKGDTQERTAIRQCATKLLLATELFPGACRNEAEMWMSYPGSASRDALSVVDQVVCEAVHRPHTLMDDIRESCLQVGYSGNVGIESLPFSPVAAGAVRRILRLQKGADGKTSEPLGKLCEIMMYILRAQTDYRPLARLICTSLDTFDLALVSYSRYLLGIEQTLPILDNGVREQSPDIVMRRTPLMVYARPDVVSAGLLQQYRHGIEWSIWSPAFVGLPDGIGVGEDLIAENLEIESVDVVTQRLAHELALIVYIEPLEKRWSRKSNIGLFVKLLASYLPSCRDSTRHLVMTSACIGRLCEYQDSEHRTALLVLFSSCPVDGQPLRKFSSHISLDLKSTDHDVVRNACFEAQVLGRCTIPSDVRSSLLNSTIQLASAGPKVDVNRRCRQDVSNALSSLIDLDGRAGAEDTENWTQIAHILSLGLTDGSPEMTTLARRCVTSSNLFARAAGTYVVALNSDTTTRRCLKQRKRRMSDDLGALSREVHWLRSSITSELGTALQRGEHDEKLVWSFMPAVVWVLKAEPSLKVLGTVERLAGKLLLQQAAERTLDLDSWKVLGNLLHHSAVNPDTSHRKLSRVIKMLCRERATEEGIRGWLFRKRGRQDSVNDLERRERLPEEWTDGRGSTSVWLALTTAPKLRGTKRRRKRCADAAAMALTRKEVDNLEEISQALLVCRGSSLASSRIQRRVDSATLGQLVRNFLRRALYVKETGLERGCAMLRLVGLLLEALPDRTPSAGEVLDRLNAHSQLSEIFAAQSDFRPLIEAICTLASALLQSLEMPNEAASRLAKLAAENAFIGAEDGADRAVRALLSAAQLREVEISRGLLADSLWTIQHLEHSRMSSETAKADSSPAYSRSFLIETACKALACVLEANSTEVIDLRKLIDDGVFSAALEELSQEDESLRALSYAFLHLFHKVIEESGDGSKTTSASLFRERKQFLFFLELLLNSVTEPLQRLPGVHAQFFSLVVRVMLRPSHSLFPAVMKFLLRRSTVGLDDTYFFSHFINSDESGSVAVEVRRLALRALMKGAKTEEDHELLRRRHVYEQLMIQVNVERTIAGTRHQNEVPAGLTALAAVVERVPGAAAYLVRKHGLFAWIAQELALSSNPSLEEYCRLFLSACKSISRRADSRQHAGEAGQVFATILRSFLRRKMQTTQGAADETGGLTSRIYDCLIATWSISLRRRGAIHLSLSETHAAHRQLSEYDRDQLPRVFAYTKIVAAREDVEGLLQLATVCFRVVADRNLSKDSLKRSDLLATAAAGCEIVCISLLPSDLRGNVELAWALSLALMTTTSSHVRRVLFAAGLRVALCSNIPADERAKLAEAAVKLENPDYVLRQLVAPSGGREDKIISATVLVLCGVLQRMPPGIGPNLQGRKRKSESAAIDNGKLKLRARTLSAVDSHFEDD